MKKDNYNKGVMLWMFVILFMLFIQIMIGGITRLTGSGLSITKWEIVTGTLPPLDTEAWQEAFDLYKESPQYAKINEGMSLGKFKFIYFWEYFHRLWARLLGPVILFPALFFFKKNYLNRWLIKRLLITVGLIGVVASFGWIMVASGLIHRPWVNAYKLSLHLGLAIVVVQYHLRTILVYRYKESRRQSAPRMKGLLLTVICACCFQIFVGGMLSGMRAALSYPTFPKYHDSWIPEAIKETSSWKLESLIDYDRGPFAAGLVQFVHRNMAYLIFVGIIMLFFYFRRRVIGSCQMKIWMALLVMLLLQMTLGILTLIGSIGTIPVFYGVAHQLVGIILLSLIFVLYYLEKPAKVATY